MMDIHDMQNVAFLSNFSETLRSSVVNCCSADVKQHQFENAKSNNTKLSLSSLLINAGTLISRVEKSTQIL